MTSRHANAPRHAGRAFDLIDHTLGEFPEYRAFRAGVLSRADYCRWVRTNADALADTGLNTDQVNLSTRFPIDDRAFVADALDRLARLGILPGTDYPLDEFDRFADRVHRVLRHDGFMTYIFPEEARLLFAIAHIVRPRATVFPGSYYGYWAVWALPGITAAHGHITLVYINKYACVLARENVNRLGLSANVTVVEHDAIDYGATLDRIDMVILDAEGPKHEGPEHLRDKAIYAPIMAATTSALRPGGLLVAHNMLLENLTDNPYFAGKVAHNRRQYATFQRHLDEHYDRQCVLPSSEGVGIYRRVIP